MRANLDSNNVMNITEKDGQIIFKFSADDRRHKWPQCEAIIAEIKQKIHSAERDFNPLSNEWTVNKIHREFIEKLRDEHLRDKNQQSLF